MSTNSHQTSDTVFGVEQTKYHLSTLSAFNPTEPDNRKAFVMVGTVPRPFSSVVLLQHVGTLGFIASIIARACHRHLSGVQVWTEKQD